MSERPSPRVDIRLTGVLKVDGESPVRTSSVNLSETGLLLRGTRMVERGTAVQMEFPEFKGSGEVIWNRKMDNGYLIGVKFRSLGWRDRRKVRELVALAEH